MYEDKKKKGGGKKKGSAKESDAQEAKNLVNDMEGGIKNAGDNEKSAKELKAEGKKLKQQARDKKKADRKSARATKRSDRKTKKSQKLQDKIDLQTLKGEQKSKAGKTISAQAKKDRVEKLKTKKEKLDGAAKKKPDANGDGVPDYAQDGIGASRMGFTQSFGAARQNSYAKGAAKVASIMSFGASKKKGAADPNPEDPSHTHSMNQQDINSMRSTMGDFEGTQGGGGYANRSNYENFSKTSKTLPKGVIQDYSNSGGSANPYIAKDELQSVLNKTKGGMFGAGTDSDSPFTENPENPSSRAYYSPSSGVSGVDPQTNRETLYGGQQSNSNNVQAFSSAFQGNMRETIKLRKEGVKAKGLKSKGVVANTELKAPILGASKKPHGKKKKH
jgi:hypothetical protein